MTVIAPVNGLIVAVPPVVTPSVAKSRLPSRDRLIGRINVTSPVAWGDAAIGFTGMDFETAVRERIPILSVLLNNFCMAIELKVMPVSTERYHATDISGDYAAMARAFGAYGERIIEPDEIVPAIRRGIALLREALLETSRAVGDQEE